MHVIFRESHGLEEIEAPRDLGQTPADVVVLSFSDSDLGAFAVGWHRAQGGLPSLRLANLTALRHPLSVDTYVEATLVGAKAILIRLIGGESYWSYGLMRVQDLARRHRIAVAVLPADGRPDPQLDEFCTLPTPTVRRLTALCDAGGAVAAQAALAELASAAGFPVGPVAGEEAVPECGWYDPHVGVIAPFTPDGPAVAVVFYRSYLTAADTGPVDALITALRARGFAAVGLFAPSLKTADAAAWMRETLLKLAPVTVISATAFSARGDDGLSPLDSPGCPVFQVALATAHRCDWAASERGLSPADLAMHVVLPEVDGRIFAGVASFKSPGQRDPDLQLSRCVHRAEAGRIDSIADRVTAWHRLGTTPAFQRRLALVLSTYPGRADQMAHAVGLDTLASCQLVLNELAAEGYATACGGPLAPDLQSQTLTWPVSDYRAAVARLPPALQDALAAAWGNPEDDPDVCDGAFHFAAVRRGCALVALQPERGEAAARGGEYHDLKRCPRHAYVAFYLWLRSERVHALLHIGAHGTLEWLPGKSVALSEACWPEALIGPLPVIYPFIVNNPGEAAQAKRRIGAVTLGHLPPPQLASQVPEGLLRLERLLDEYSTADGLDPARRDRLIAAIREEARVAGVENDLGLASDASAAEAITRIDRFVCDIKESQFGDGLHVYGQGACGREERAGLVMALAGRRVPPGPAGSPHRGWSDMLPTGRNLYAVDPRAVPSRAAHAQGVKLAEELLRRHQQDNGDWPRGLMIDLWGSATMRTAGEEFAMALHLAGLAPLWDQGSERVSGFEVLPLALLGRPRIDVTLRVSGLFRDVFPGLAQMFEAAATALVEREESLEDNPYRTPAPRVFCPRPGHYGLALGAAAEDYGADGRQAAGEAWLVGSEWVIDSSGEARRDRAALEARVRTADAFAHVQDLAESDLLLSADYAAHEGGFAAAVARLGGAAPAQYHLDSTNPDAPRARTIPEEIARVVRARAANPDWASGMMRHGFRGAAEVAATLDNLAAFAHLTRAVPGHLFDLYHEATLGRQDLVAFMQRENPAALAALHQRFRALHDAGVWVTRRNSIAAALASTEIDHG